VGRSGLGERNVPLLEGSRYFTASGANRPQRLNRKKLSLQNTAPIPLRAKPAKAASISASVPTLTSSIRTPRLAAAARTSRNAGNSAGFSPRFLI
jgi:hypothetical protein